MAKKRKPTHKSADIVLQDDTRIGDVAAESDEDFLFKCFVDNNATQQAIQLNNKSILAGRTGSGKTAILKYIKNRFKNCAEIDPSEMSMEYISNSDVFQFLNDIGADLDLLFQVLWKHVLCIQFIKLRYELTSESQYQSFFRTLIDKVKRDPTKKRALEYLKKWGKDFWIDMDENVRAISEHYASKIEAELGIDISATKSKSGFARNMSRDQKSEYARRARKIIDGRQLGDLAKVLGLFSGKEATSNNNTYYLLIDKLDERWADDSIKFRLIRALIETIRSFDKIRNLKIIVALRTDVIERSIQENIDTGFQREKFKDQIIEIKWTKAQLKEVVNKRIRTLYQWKYTKNNVTFEDIFTDKIPPNSQCFDYMIERTLLRPRDIIDFVNHCLQYSEGATSVTAKKVKQAEKSYSEDRYRALLDEWRTAFPSLRTIFEFFAGKNTVQIFEDLSAKELFVEVALQIATGKEANSDPIWIMAKAVLDERTPITQTLIFGKLIFSTLYRVGACGLKLTPEDAYAYGHINGATIEPTSIPYTCRLRFHPMISPAINTSGSIRR